MPPLDEDTGPAVKDHHAADLKGADWTQHGIDDEKCTHELPTQGSPKYSQHSGHDADETGHEPPQQHSDISNDVYSIFTVPQKRAIILTGSFASWFSPMSGSIYFPALNQIAERLDVSSAKVNITVTTYLVSEPCLIRLAWKLIGTL